MKTVILDHVEGAAVAGDLFTDPAHDFIDYGTDLLTVWEDLESCHRRLAHEEIALRSGRTPDWGTVRGACGWYAVNVGRYVSSVGELARLTGNTIFDPREYVHRVLPEMREFEEREAQWRESHSPVSPERLVFQANWLDDAMRVSGIWLGAGPHADFVALTPWSPVQVQERLRMRYWPSPPPLRIESPSRPVTGRPGDGARR